MYISDVNTFLSVMPLTAVIMYCTIYTTRKIQIKKEILYIFYIGAHKAHIGQNQSICFHMDLGFFSKRKGF